MARILEAEVAVPAGCQLGEGRSGIPIEGCCGGWTAARVSIAVWAGGTAGAGRS
jgi:hypothetical protein